MRALKRAKAEIIAAGSIVVDATAHEIVTAPVGWTGLQTRAKMGTCFFDL